MTVTIKTPYTREFVELRRTIAPAATWNDVTSEWTMERAEALAMADAMQVELDRLDAMHAHGKTYGRSNPKFKAADRWFRFDGARDYRATIEALRNAVETDADAEPVEQFEVTRVTVRPDGENVAVSINDRPNNMTWDLVVSFRDDGRVDVEGYFWTTMPDGSFIPSNTRHSRRTGVEIYTNPSIMAVHAVAIDAAANARES